MKTGTYSFPETHNGGNNQRQVAAKTLTAVKFSLMLKKSENRTAFRHLRLLALLCDSLVQ